jgi:hypothetical protein
MASIRDKKFIFIPGFFNKEELKILQTYCKKRVYKNIEWCVQSPFSPSYYKDPLMDTFLHIKKEKAEEIAGLKLFETYAYWRYYINGAPLKDHKDRESCEISISACIGNCGTKWPIHFDNNWLDLNVGDAVMYLGCDVLHGRKPFEGVENPQVFFHYVDQNGPYKHFKGDKR